MTQSGRHVLVVGAGVIGTACAHYLVESGQRVTLVDRNTVGGEASHGNCGCICPSHLLPLAEPGIIGRALAGLVRRSTPFFVAPRFDLSLWLWLLRFAGNCREKQMIQTGHDALALLQQSRMLYDELIKKYQLKCDWETKGALYVCKQQQTFKALSAKNELLRTEFGIQAKKLVDQQLTDMEPALRQGLAGAWYFPNDAHLRPDRLLRSWSESLVRRGITVREQTEVCALSLRDGRARAVITDRGEIPAEQFVFATGAMTPSLAGDLGWQAPIQPAKGYSLTMPRPQTCPQRALHFVDYGVVATPWRSGYRLGSILEFSGYNRHVDPHRVALLKEGADQYLTEPCKEMVEETWVGWRSMTPDGLPRVGPCPEVSNVYVAAGHNMLGMSMAPATGQMIAQMLNDQSPAIDPEPYRLSA
jgi:D-amino-acid dehydrogenase